MCSASFGKPRASIREGNDDCLEFRRAGNPHVVCAVQQLPVRRHICASRQGGFPAGSEVASWGNRTLAGDPARLPASSCQRIYSGQTKGTWGRHSLIKSVVSGKGTTAEEVQGHRRQGHWSLGFINVLGLHGKVLVAGGLQGWLL